MNCRRIRVRPAFLLSLALSYARREGMIHTIPLLAQILVTLDNSRWNMRESMKRLRKALDKGRVRDLIRDYTWSIISRIPVRKQELKSIFYKIEDYYMEYSKTWEDKLPSLMKRSIRYEAILNEVNIISAIRRIFNVDLKNNILLWFIEEPLLREYLIYERPDRGILLDDDIVMRATKILSRICLENVGFIKRDFIIHPRVCKMIRAKVEEIWKCKALKKMVISVYEKLRKAKLKVKGPKFLVEMCLHWYLIDEISALPYSLISKGSIARPHELIMEILSKTDIEVLLARFPLSKILS
ncbi:MAG: hypothetical protein DRJ66_05740 [Thermoprotei archaeon]|nr:MAG: hypothetical protein DRJ66_05740 [Thermoprotei archaeon]RLF18067.1 MAG: hypothetical protein DRZ82_08930 [Thermoprotei archaeon]